MKKRASKAQLFSLFCLIFAVILGIYFANVKTRLNEYSKCDLAISACSVKVFGEDIRLKFDQTPVPEEELFLSFDMPEGLTVDKAWIEGVNMYMGKTPLMFEDPMRPDKAVTFLGSCNLVQMQWMLYVDIKKDDSPELSSFAVPFTTTR